MANRYVQFSPLVIVDTLAKTVYALFAFTPNPPVRFRGGFSVSWVEVISFEVRTAVVEPRADDFWSWLSREAEDLSALSSTEKQVAIDAKFYADGRKDEKELWEGT